MLIGNLGNIFLTVSSNVVVQLPGNMSLDLVARANLARG